MEKNKNKKTRPIIKRKLLLNIDNNISASVFPHHPNINNLKSIKYFSTISSNSDLIKNALQKYRANSTSSNYQNKNEILQATNSTISTLSGTKKLLPIKNKKNKVKTCFNKLAPKLLHIASKTSINNDMDEFKISKKEEIKTHKKIGSVINPNLNNNFIDILDEEDSLNFDLDFDDFNFNNNKYNTLTERNKNDLNICINLNDINFNECLKIENLFNELIKDLENNKLEKFENKLIIVKKFLMLFNDNFNQNLFLTFDLNSLNINNNNDIFLLIKEYLIQQLVFFYIIIIISLIKSKQERNIYLSGIQNLCFYFHQNFQVLNFILTSRVNKNNINLLGSVKIKLGLMKIIF